jgi:cell division protein FtsQ
MLGGAVVATLALAFGAYRFATSGSSGGSHPSAPRPTSVIGNGPDAVGVSASGEVLSRRPPPAAGSLPQLPLDKPPKHKRLAGPALQQAIVLGAAPPVLRSCIEGSYYGESGVDVRLASGIELLFGSASRAARKWSAAAAILADPTITEIGYVDLHSPGRASTGGSGTTLPQAEPGSSATCGR